MNGATGGAAQLHLKGWQRLLLPNLPSIAAIVVLYLGAAGMGPEVLFNDAGTGWHIVTGARRLETSELPRVDTDSFTKAGQPWSAWEWLADVGMA